MTGAHSPPSTPVTTSQLPPPPLAWRLLCDHTWLLRAVLSFVDDGGHEIHSLWLLALDDELRLLTMQLEQHYTVSVRHARRLAMASSQWTVLLKLSRYVTYSKGQRLTHHQVDAIEAELTALGVAHHPDRRRVLLTAVGLDHKTGTRRLSCCCAYCDRGRQHQCRVKLSRCTAPGRHEVPHYCRAESSTALYAAARAGCLESVVWLHTVVCYNQERALTLAAQNGHACVVAWLLDHAHSDVVVDFRYHDDETIGVLAWRVTSNPQYYTITKRWGIGQSLDQYMPVCLAAKHGDVDGLRQLFAHAFFRPLFKSTTLALAVASSGHLPVLDYLWATCPAIFTNSSALWSAARAGHLPVVEWLVTRGVGAINAQSVRPAVLYGHLEMLQWMLMHASEPEAVRRSIVELTADGTTLRTLQWLVLDHGLRLTTTTHATMAIRRKDLELTKWIVGHCTATRPLTNGRALLKTAIKSGSLELVQWFVDELHVWSPKAFQLASAVSNSAEILAFTYHAARARQALHPHTTTDLLVVAKRQSRFDPNSVDAIEWLLDHGFRSGLFETGALDTTLCIERDVANAQRTFGLFQTTYHPATMRRFRALICRLIHDYDPAFLRHVHWLPKWAARHGTVDALARLTQIDRDAVLTRKRFDALLLESTTREVVVRWFLEQQPSLCTTLVVRWAATHGKHGILSWVLETFLPSQSVETLGTDPKRLLRKCVHTASWTAARHWRCRSDGAW